MVSPNADQYRVVEELCAHMTDVLKKWYCSLGPVRQDKFYKLDNTDIVIAALHHKFLGDHNLVQMKIRKEYFDMKWYQSLNTQLSYLLFFLKVREYIIDVSRENEEERIQLTNGILLR